MAELALAAKVGLQVLLHLRHGELHPGDARGLRPIDRRGRSAWGRPVLLHAEDFDYVTAATARVKAARAAKSPEWSDYCRLAAARRPRSSSPCASALALARGREEDPAYSPRGDGRGGRARGRRGRELRDLRALPRLRPRGLRAPRRGAQDRPRREGRGPSASRLWALLADGSIDFVDERPRALPARGEGDGRSLDRLRRHSRAWAPWAPLPPYSEGLVRGRLTLPRFLEASSGAGGQKLRPLRPERLPRAGQGRGPRPHRSPFFHDSDRSGGEKLLSKGHISRPSRAWSFKGRVPIESTFVPGVGRP